MVAAVTSPVAPTPADTIQPVVAVPVLAAAPRQRDRHRTTVAVGQSSQSSDDQAIQRQLEFRVLMPALTGDGGG